MIAIVAAFAALNLQYAHAETFNASNVFTEITIYEGQSFAIHNDSYEAFSITAANGAFVTSNLPPGANASMDNIPIGTYSFSDPNNPTKTGILHVLPKPTPTIDPIGTVQAGDLITIHGINFESSSNQITLLINKPDGTEYHTLTVYPTSSDEISIPLQTIRIDQNGIYTIHVANQSFQFSIAGGVTRDNPLEVAPTTNSTTIEPTPQVDETSPGTTPINIGTINENTTLTINPGNLNFTASEKATLIALLQKLIDLLNSTAN